MKKRALIFIWGNLLLACQILTSLTGQELVGPDRGTLALPVDIPIFLAGNFGEPRANHFHSGIDIKTNGATGVPVKSVADGYVSRIKVEGGGYGRAIYIRHPNGYTSLYGHLLSFNETIRKYVNNEQYRRESFAVDLFPEPDQLVVKKGQIIALSGNSGSSEGPHIHFELRETQSENPVNPLVRSIPVTDNIPPVITRLYVYSLNERGDWIKPVTTALVKSGSEYRPGQAMTLPLAEVSGIGIETYDLLNGSDNRCGVYKIRGYIDDKLFFESCLDEVSFSETRYMNSFMDYKTFITSRKAVIKLFIDPNNQGSMYRFASNRGRIEIKEARPIRIKIVVEDAAGNESVALAEAALDPSKFRRNPDFLPVYSAFFSCRETNNFRADGLDVNLPAGALYDDIFFTFESDGRLPNALSPVYRVHQSEVPVHLYYRIGIDGRDVPEKLRTKATIAQVLGNGRYSSLGGSWEGDRLVARTRNFGTFCIMADTVKPSVSPQNFNTAAELKTLGTLRFTVKDDFSGIQSYRGEIDGQWILLEYDPKNSLLEYHFDNQRIKSGTNHKLTVRVTDQLGNSRSYSISFFR